VLVENKVWIGYLTRARTILGLDTNVVCDGNLMQPTTARGTRTGLRISQTKGRLSKTGIDSELGLESESGWNGRDAQTEL